MTSLRYRTDQHCKSTSTEIYMVRPKRRDISCQTENVDIATIEHERWQDEEIVNLPSASMEFVEDDLEESEDLKDKDYIPDEIDLDEFKMDCDNHMEM
ncbi:hypothetical protein EB796_016261 [Bugula neritina]|nr:hypothetical protein EB796_016261 [Bugula neritina]